MDRVGQFRIVDEVADRGLGRVFRAEDEGTRDPIELRRVELDPSARAGALASVQPLIGIDHPNLSTLIDAGATEDGIYLASQWIDGQTLADRIGAEAVELPEMLRIAQEITSAVAALHRAGTIHGALDATAVRLDAQGAARVTRLGVGVLHGERDPRTDVRAIGELMHAMSSAARVPPGVDDVIRRARGSIEKRPADADALLAQLTAIDLPVEPIPNQVAEARKDINEGSSLVWLIGSSIAIAVVIGLIVVAIVFGR